MSCRSVLAHVAEGSLLLSSLWQVCVFGHCSGTCLPIHSRLAAFPWPPQWLLLFKWTHSGEFVESIPSLCRAQLARMQRYAKKGFIYEKSESISTDSGEARRVMVLPIVDCPNLLRASWDGGHPMITG